MQFGVRNALKTLFSKPRDISEKPSYLMSSLSHRNPHFSKFERRLVDSAFSTIISVQGWIIESLKKNPDRFLEPMKRRRDGKSVLPIDEQAELQAVEMLEESLGGKERVLVIGEETPIAERESFFSSETRLIALIDMVDGTDLLARHLSNWCSAIAFYQKGQILGTFVGLPNQGVYMATRREPCAWLSPHPKMLASGRESLFQKKANFSRLGGPNKSSTLENASICFFGQKLKNVLSMLNHRRLIAKFRDLVQKSPETRIYNFAGNPMMTRMVHGHVPIDAVVELTGQQLHDVVPGAFIAQKAGAILTDLDGRRLNLDKIIHKTASPFHRIKYILSGSKSLHKQLVKLLKDGRRA